MAAKIVKFNGLQYRVTSSTPEYQIGLRVGDKGEVVFGEALVLLPPGEITDQVMVVQDDSVKCWFVHNASAEQIAELLHALDPDYGWSAATVEKGRKLVPDQPCCIPFNWKEGVTLERIEELLGSGK